MSSLFLVNLVHLDYDDCVYRFLSGDSDILVSPCKAFSTKEKAESYIQGYFRTALEGKSNSDSDEENWDNMLADCVRIVNIPVGSFKLSFQDEFIAIVEPIHGPFNLITDLSLKDIYSQINNDEERSKFIKFLPEFFTVQEIEVD